MNIASVNNIISYKAVQLYRAALYVALALFEIMEKYFSGEKSSTVTPCYTKFGIRWRQTYQIPLSAEDRDLQFWCMESNFCRQRRQLMETLAVISQHQAFFAIYDIVNATPSGIWHVKMEGNTMSQRDSGSPLPSLWSVGMYVTVKKHWCLTSVHSLIADAAPRFFSVVSAVYQLLDKQCSWDALLTNILKNKVHLLPPYLAELYNRSLTTSRHLMLVCFWYCYNTG